MPQFLYFLNGRTEVVGPRHTADFASFGSHSIAHTLGKFLTTASFRVSAGLKSSRDLNCLTGSDLEPSDYSPQAPPSYPHSHRRWYPCFFTPG